MGITHVDDISNVTATVSGKLMREKKDPRLEEKGCLSWVSDGGCRI